jgi:hypothetical protein
MNRVSLLEGTAELEFLALHGAGRPEAGASTAPSRGAPAAFRFR